MTTSSNIALSATSNWAYSWVRVKIEVAILAAFKPYLSASVWFYF